MRTFVKNLSLFLAVILLLANVCSCELLVTPDATALVTEAEAALAAAPYSINMKIIYESEDSAMQSVVDSFSDPVITMKVDGENFSANMEYTKDGYKNFITYAYIDGDLYTEKNENGKLERNKLHLDGLDKNAVASAVGVDATLGFSDFSTVTTKSSGSVSVITCTDIKVDSLGKLTANLANRLSSLDAIVKVSDVSLAIQINGGKYDITILTCTYTITTQANVYNLEMTFATKFDYSGVSVVAPFAD